MKSWSFPALVCSWLTATALAQTEKPFHAVPEYSVNPILLEEEVGHRKIAPLDRSTIDSIARFVQDFYQRYNPKALPEVLEDPQIGSFLTEDYVQRLKRAVRAAKVSGEAFFAPGHSDWNDLYKYYAAFTTEEADQYITDFAVGSTKEEEGTYSHHIWVIVRRHGDGWRISDLRDMGNG